MTKRTDYGTIAETALLLGVSRNTLRLWSESGNVPVHRNPANEYRLFRNQNLEAFLERSESDGTMPRPSQP